MSAVAVDTVDPLVVCNNGWDEQPLLSVFESEGNQQAAWLRFGLRSRHKHVMTPVLGGEVWGSGQDTGVR